MTTPARGKRTPAIWSVASIAIVLAVWQAVTAGGLVKAIFLPAPLDTFRALYTLVASGSFATALAYSFGRIAVATTLAVLVGGVIGTLMGLSKRADAFFAPIVEPLRYVPITALIPLLILWLGIGEPMKITFLFAGIVFYFIPLVRNAIRSVPHEFVDTANAFGANRRTLLTRVYLPHALPQIFDGLIVINGLGWTYIILAEIINAKQGLGYLISIAGRLSRSDEVFAALILIVSVAFVSDRVLHRVRDTYLFW